MRDLFLPKSRKLWLSLAQNLAGSVTPKALGKIPYYLAMKSFGYALEGSGAAYWPRNSFVTGALVPFKSDLDLTIWFEGKPQPEEISAVLNAHRFVKSFFPLMGEINFYDSSEAKTLARFVNPIELRRDPRLVATLQNELREATRAERVTFLARMIEADALNLKYLPNSRIQKWRHHAELCGLMLPFPLSLRGLVEKMLEVAGLEAASKSEAKASLVEYLELKAEGLPFRVIMSDRWRVIFFPYRFCFEDRSFERLDPRAAEIALAQLKWEIWGLSSQYRLFLAKDFAERASLLTHFRSLVRFVELSFEESADASAVRDAFKELAEKFRRDSFL